MPKTKSTSYRGVGADMYLRLLGRVLGVLVVSWVLGSPSVEATWSRTYGGNGSEEARAVRQTSDGGYIVAGRTNSFGAGGSDMWVIKLDGGGNVQWERTYGGAGNEIAHSVRQISGGGYIVAGETSSFGLGGLEMWVLELDSSGNVQWEQTYGSVFGNEIAYSVREKPTGGYVVSGRTDAIMGVTLPPDVLVLDIDSLGNLQWQMVYGGISDMQNEALAAALTDDNGDGVADDGIIVAGFLLPMLGTHPDIWVVKLDSVGTVQWERVFDSGLPLVNGDLAYSVEQTSDGGFVVAGEAPSNNADFWIIKLDSMGNVLWQTSHGSASGDAAFGVQQTSDGGYITAGFTTVNGNDAFLVKLDSNGILQWQKSYGGNLTDQARAIQQTADGGFVVAGFADSFGVGGRDLWVFKTDSNGDLDSGCNLVTTTSFMLTFTNLGLGMATVLSSPAIAGTNISMATAQSSTLGRLTQCVGPSQLNTRVTQAAVGDHEQECAIAIDPTNSNNQAVAYMDDPAVTVTVRFPSVGVSYTTDGGGTWNDSQVRFGCDGVDNDFDGMIDEEIFCDGQDDDFDGMIDEDLCCNLQHIDPSIAADGSGDLYAAFIAHEPLATSFTGSAYVVAAQSTDNGATWTTYPPLDQSVYTPGGPFVDFLDKNWLVVDNDTTSPQTGTAYVAWQRDDNLSGQTSNVFVSSLAPGGTTWSTPVRVNDPMQQCADAPYPVAGVGGDLWVIWRHSSVCPGGSQFWLDKSINGGLTWSADIPGQGYTPIPTTLYMHSYRTSDFPFLAVDPTNPNALYVVYSEDPAGADEADISFQRSLNGGMTWLTTGPVRVNNDATAYPQYFPVVLAKQNPAGWTLVDVFWVDERNSIGCDGLDNDVDGLIDEELANGIDDDFDGMIDEDVCDIRIDVYFARSVDAQTGTPTFGPSVRVSSLSFGRPGIPPNFLGDYVDLVTSGATDYAVWADTRGGDNDVYWDQIGDVDSDGDSFLDFADCNPSDNSAYAVPGVVQNVTISPIAASTNVAVSWQSQAASAGSGTVYDLVSGLLSSLTSTGGYGSAICLANNVTGTSTPPYTDTRSGPPAGDSFYYLIRAHNSCGVASFGATGPMDPKAALDGTTPCPI